MDTRTKLRVAHFAHRALRRLGVDDHQTVTRRGIRFDLDLREGIDLSLFLFGSFQAALLREARRVQRPGPPVFVDVGANLGAMALALARAVPDARVFAFEPTDFAFEKLKRNLALNPELADRVEATQAFVTASDSAAGEAQAFASWRIDDLGGHAGGGDRHPVHLGAPMAATSQAVTLDRFVSERSLHRLDLLKVDTDGHELDVLQGAARALEEKRPRIVFEVGTYLLEERGARFSDFEDLLLPLGYRLLDVRSRRRLSAHDLARQVPRGGTIDVVAVPPPR